MREEDRDVDVSFYEKLGVNIFYGKTLPSKLDQYISISFIFSIDFFQSGIRFFC